MKFIRAKLILNGIAINQPGISGFEGPASLTAPNDGFGNPVHRGQVTSLYMVQCVEKKSPKGVKFFDGECNVPDTPYNRTKLAVHILSGDMDVLDEATKEEILANHAPAKGERGSPSWKNPKLHGKTSKATAREVRSFEAWEKQRAREAAAAEGPAPKKRAAPRGASREVAAQDVAQGAPITAGDESIPDVG